MCAAIVTFVSYHRAGFAKDKTCEFAIALYFELNVTGACRIIFLLYQPWHVKKQAMPDSSLPSEIKKQSCTTEKAPFADFAADDGVDTLIWGLYVNLQMPNHLISCNDVNFDVVSKSLSSTSSHRSHSYVHGSSTANFSAGHFIGLLCGLLILVLEAPRSRPEVSMTPYSSGTVKKASLSKVCHTYQRSVSSPPRYAMLVQVWKQISSRALVVTASPQSKK